MPEELSPSPAPNSKELSDPPPSWGALDVQYAGDSGWTGYVEVHAWSNERCVLEKVTVHRPVAPYRSGFFYERELPCLLTLLETLGGLPRHLVVDGYVQLPGGRKGLGEHLYEALDGACAVIGVSKTKIVDDMISKEVLRGESTQPLMVTALGMHLNDAAAAILSMHGRFRIPTLLKRADRLARDAAEGTTP